MVRNSAVARLVSLAALSLSLSACSQQATSVPVRSLEQSGRVSFVCVGDGPAPLETCTSSGDAYTHSLLALVTQTVRGEVAVVNLSQGAVIDLDKSMPGYNFIPTGARPVDIVSTPGSTASFVASGEANKYAIYVIPSDRLLDPAPRLTSFSACALPTAPGRMAVVTQASTSNAPSTCDGVSHAGVPHDNGDLGLETIPPGSRKLVVTLPERGEVAIIDAQQLLDQPRGSFQACQIERLVKLRVDLPATLPEQRWPADTAAERAVCEFTPPVEVSRSETFEPHPVSLEIDKETGLAYIADDAAPVVHVLDLSDPCNPIERDPLLPMSATEPSRVVFTREVAVSPTTSDGRKYAYAIDYREGSAMVFDVSLGSADRTPLLHPNPEENPFQPVDRISFAVPIKTFTFVLRDDPIVDPTTGAAPYGVKCDPDINSSSPGTAYRNNTDYSAGAGPEKLRGIFGTAVLANGQIVIIDVDDFDAACRRQRDKCDPDEIANYQGATDELSCRVVEPHQARNAGLLSSNDVSGARMPGLQTYPTLTQTGTTLPVGSANPIMLAPRTIAGLRQVVQVGGTPVDKIERDPHEAVHAMVWFDTREPRAHYDQDWNVVYEGQIPAFRGRVARLRPAAEQGRFGTVEDGSAGFCWAGVHDYDAALLVAQATLDMSGSAQEPGSPADNWAREHMDAVQITDGLLDRKDPYWSSPLGECSYQVCLESFGPPDVPKSTRDLPIRRAYQDRVEVEDPLGTGLAMAQCCFPQLTTYTVRALGQWVVTGSVSGFLHKVDVDPTTGRCVDSCDPTLRYRNARAYEGPFIEPGVDAEQFIPVVDSGQVFRNPMMQFWIHPGTLNGKPVSSERDMTFAFTANGGFFPLLVNLASATTYVQPQSVTWLPQIGQLAVADGSVQGLMMVDIASLTLSKSYY